MSQYMELLKEISDLVQIRQYLANTMGNPVLDRATVTIMNNTLLLLDKKIVGLLQSSSFQNYIGYEYVKQAVEEAARITNIKSGMKK
jgi:hypothetical protein